MSGEIEGVGDAVLGGLAARAVEPKSGEAGEPGANECLNCGAALVGPYCHQCGQEGHLHRTLTAIWHDLLHGVLHFEGKIWHTLPLLLVKPGELTRRYIHGHRARFISPLALFLFSVFIMFAVIQAIGARLEAPTLSPDATQGAVEQMTEMKKGNDAAIAELEGKIAKAKAAGEDSSADERELARAKRMAVDIEREFADYQATGKPPMFTDVISKTGWEALDKGIAKARENPSLALYKVQTSAYKFSWLLIPISIPFVWLLFAWRRKYKLYDHAIFVIYSLSFFTLLGVVLTIANSFGLTWRAGMWIFMIAVPVHMFIQLKGAYELKWWNAALRTFILLIFSFIAFLLFMLALLALGIMG